MIKSYGEIKMNCRHAADVAVCDEVIKRQTYLRPRLGFMVRPKSLWLDIGANIGAFSVWAGSQRASEVIAYEPCSENYKLAKQNMELNNVPGQVHQVAVGHENGSFDVRYNPDTPARSSSQATKGTVERTKMVDFNDVVDVLQPNGIKLDAEGAELAILDGNVNLDGVDYLVMEYHARFDKSIENARRRLKPVASQFKNCRIPKSLVTGDGEYPSWIDPICFFWN